MELCDGGDLYSRDPYTEKEAARITSSILSAVAYMHSHNVTHRDLKYENVMFANKNADAEVKLIDFGLSAKYGIDETLHDTVGKYGLHAISCLANDGMLNDVTSFISGTVYSMSPEVLRGQYTFKVDVWSVGVLAYMLLSSSMPFYGSTRYDTHVQSNIFSHHAFIPTFFLENL
jgi:serine/threonine protein kinase